MPDSLIAPYEVPDTMSEDVGMFDIPVAAGKVAVIAHDAGAANQILHWFSAGDLDIERAVFSLDGPALAIARQLFPGLEVCDIERAIREADWVLCGTGWSTTIEKQAMALARVAGKIVVAVLDHWVNYPPRFNNPVKPEVDEIWVVDNEAFTLARSLFPDTRVVRKPGRYLEDQAAHVSSNVQAGQVLFLMEPVRADWPAKISGETTVPGEFSAFHFFLSNLRSAKTSVSQVVIRPHPSDEPDKYLTLLKQSDCDVEIRVSDELSLSEALSTAEYVVGLNSYAMVVALAANKKVYCALPPEAPECLLPHDGILDLRNVSFGV